MSGALNREVYERFQKALADKNTLRRALRLPGARLGMLIIAANGGDVTAMQRLLDAGLNINHADHCGYTALHFEAAAGNVESVRCLIQLGADVNAASHKNETPLNLAIRGAKPEIVRLLLESGADPNRVEHHNFTTPLTGAALRGQTEIVKLLVEAGAEIENTDPTRSPAVLAAVNGHIDTLEFLLGAGADPSLILTCVANVAETSVLECLLHRGANVNHLLQGYGTPLIQACLVGAHDNAKFFLEHGANPNLFPPSACPALMQSVAKGHSHLVPLLLKHGADINAVVEGNTALLTAIDNKDLGCVRFLMNAGAEADIPNRGEALLRAHGHPEMMDLLRSHGATDLIAETDATLDKIWEGVINGEREKVLALLDTPWLAPSLYSVAIGSALTAAAAAGHLHMLEEFLGKGADPNCVVTDSGLTPLLEAIAGSHPEIVGALLQAGADVNKPSETGYPPLYVASLNGRLDMVRQLIGGGADIDAAGPEGLTPLMCAVHGQHYDVVAELINSGSDPRRCDQYNRTALMLAAHLGHVSIGEILILGGANLNTQDVNGQTALMYAAHHGHVDFVKLLLSVDALTDIRNARKETALAVAKAAGHSHIINLLSQVA